jgi:hypothetical protein
VTAFRGKAAALAACLLRFNQRQVKLFGRYLLHRRNNNCSELLEFFGGDVAFGEAVDEVAFAPAIMQMPVVSADPYLNKLLIKEFEELLSQRPTNRGAF